MKADSRTRIAIIGVCNFYCSSSKCPGLCAIASKDWDANRLVIDSHPSSSSRNTASSSHRSSACDSSLSACLIWRTRRQRRSNRASRKSNLSVAAVMWQFCFRDLDPRGQRVQRILPVEKSCGAKSPPHAGAQAFFLFGPVSALRSILKLSEHIAIAACILHNRPVPLGTERGRCRQRGSRLRRPCSRTLQIQCRPGCEVMLLPCILF
jgi:hypothetical protein